MKNAQNPPVAVATAIDQRGDGRRHGKKSDSG
jgi:hypothetical protein